MEQPTSPLTDRDERIIEANAMIDDGEMDECPNPECDLTPAVCDLTDDSHLFVTHESDGVGLDSRTPRGERDGCKVDPSNDPTL